MPCILHIETATEVCSVAVSLNGEVIYNREEREGPSHAVNLGVFVDDAIRKVRDQNLKLDAVAVSRGPGSYTGLRIGVSQAKGLCYGFNVPLIAIDTLKIMAQSVASSNHAKPEALLCPMIDARRMEVYDAVYDPQLNVVKAVSADIIDADSFVDMLAHRQILFFGNGAAKCKAVLESSNATFIDHIHPLAVDMVSLAEEAFAAGQFVDTAYFEPFYLKEFVATTPKNKVLGANL